MRSSPLLALAALLALGGCESSQDRSAQLARHAVHLARQQGLQIIAPNPDVRILSTAVVHDANGTAAVVQLRNTSARTLVNVPIAIDVQDAHGVSLFKNDSPGLEPSLTSASVLPAHGELTWVNDQITAGGTPAKVVAEVGRAPVRTAPVPRIAISGLHLVNDPTSGEAAQGQVLAATPVVQTRLVVYGISRRGGRILAAGRAILPRVTQAKPVTFQVFFIGNPQGGQVHAIAPASVLP